MKKFEADRLEEAYDAACREFGCSITELEYEIVQYPTKGVLGLFSKKAIIVASRKKEPVVEPNKDKEEIVNDSSNDKIESIDTTLSTELESVENEYNSDTTEKSIGTLETEESTTSIAKDDVVLDSFFTDGADTKTSTTKSTIDKTPSPNIDPKDAAKEIEGHIKELIDSLCFDIDTIEVDVEGNIAYIFIDGEDAALIIGKEGYRYNALSYLLFNWINQNYGLYIKLEIARFLQSQEEMIKNYIQPVVEHVEQEGWGRTRPLDGILAQIALEQLRERFPNKYVAIKKNRTDDRRYIVINDFIKQN